MHRPGVEAQIRQPTDVGATAQAVDHRCAQSPYDRRALQVEPWRVEDQTETLGVAGRPQGSNNPPVEWPISSSRSWSAVITSAAASSSTE